MTDPGSSTPRLWGAQYPFERNHLQRTVTLCGLAGVFAVTLILLVADDVLSVLGIALVYAGLMVGFAAMSRRRYVRETEIGFAILHARDGHFVLRSAAAFLAVAVLVIVIVLP